MKKTLPVLLIAFFVLFSTLSILTSQPAEAKRCIPIVCAVEDPVPYEYSCLVLTPWPHTHNCDFDYVQTNCDDTDCWGGTTLSLIYDCRIWPWSSCELRVVQSICDTAYYVHVVWGKATNIDDDCDVDECFWGDDCYLGGEPECGITRMNCPPY